MKNYTHLSNEERYLIEYFRQEEINQDSIGKLLDRDPGTISREIKKHHKKKNSEYDAKYAIQQAGADRRNASHKGKKIEENEDLKIYIIKGLILDWGPDVIAGRMKKEGRPFYASKTAIYDWLYSAWGQMYCGLLPAQNYRKRKRKAKKTKREMIPNRVGIDARPAGFEAEFGNYEADTIVSGKRTGGKAAIVTVIDPKSKYVGLRKISSLSPVFNEAAIQSILDQYVDPKSITRDNGIENKNHQQTLTPSYFCRAYHSWEKPHIENENKLTRFYIPKGANIDDISDDQIAGSEWMLNQKPRKSLDYHTPHEVMIENRQLKNPSRKVSQYALNRIVLNCSLVALHG